MHTTANHETIHILNTETYINIKQQELVTGKKIGYEFYCEELFVGRYKSRYSSVSAIYFDLDKASIKQSCQFKFFTIKWT